MPSKLTYLKRKILWRFCRKNGFNKPNRRQNWRLEISFWSKRDSIEDCHTRSSQNHEREQNQWPHRTCEQRIGTPSIVSRTKHVPSVEIYCNRSDWKFETRIVRTVSFVIYMICCWLRRLHSVSPRLVESELSTLNPNLTPERRATMEQMPILKSKNIADGIVYAISTPEHVQIGQKCCCCVAISACFRSTNLLLSLLVRRSKKMVNGMETEEMLELYIQYETMCYVNG